MSLNAKYIIITVALGLFTVIEVLIYPQGHLGMMRNILLLALMTTKALTVVLAYMNLSREPLTLKIAFFILIPVGLYFLLFMMYDAAFIWRS
jgi:cytochrome c oxidase subunit IV